EKGKGSTFYVTIPYKPVQIESERVSMDSSDNSLSEKSYTVLVAEDEEVNYMYLEVLFEDEIEGNYNLIHAKNGQEAVEICITNNTIDLVLMDIKMPIMNGHEAAIKIKEKYPNLPVIAQTAYSTEADKQLALKHGCNDFISKPIKKEKLFELISKHLITK
ncbi:MAG: response regulator, partial [Candidatus Delongbacteria bacterium]|nr:response regulator [Candidatus Delongbacteria bacterium]